MNKDDINWVFEGGLARSRRPCYDEDVPSEDSIAEWLDRASQMRIKSILCLLSKGELRKYYAVHGIDLLSNYRKRGFRIAHIPVPDYQEPPLRDSHLFLIRVALCEYPKPLLIHCSAGIDRTGAAVEFIRGRPDLVHKPQSGINPR